ncbi:MAG: hypothetical protein AAGK23_12940, partial [Pseudomonadota bacterium]
MASPGLAQTYTPPAGWTELPNQMGPTYRNPENGSQAIVIIGPLAVTFQDANTMAHKVADAFKDIPGCDHLGSAPLRLYEGKAASLRSEAQQMECIAAARFLQNGQASSVVVVAPDLEGPEKSHFDAALAWVGAVSDDEVNEAGDADASQPPPPIS